MNHDRQPIDHLALLIVIQVRPEVAQRETRCNLLVRIRARGGTSDRNIADLRCLRIPNARQMTVAPNDLLAKEERRH